MATFNWNDVNWEDIIGRLVLFTIGRMNRMTWRGNPCKGLPPGGKEPMDFVQEAIIETMDGNRNWNQLKVSLFGHLAGVISSKISHLSVSYENKFTLNNDENNSNSTHQSIQDIIANTEDQQRNQEHNTIEELEKIAFLNYLHGFDKNLKILAELILSGSMDSSEIAEKLDVPVDYVNNLKKRLKRAVSSYLDKQRELQVSRV